MQKVTIASVLPDAEALDGLSRTLVRIGDKAATALEAALDDAEASHRVEIRAADVVTGTLRLMDSLYAIS